MDQFETWMIRAELKLAELVSSQCFMSYAELVDHAMIPPPQRIHKLTTFLEKLIADDLRLGRPIRAVFIVSKRTHLPADGFFQYLTEHGRHPDAGETQAEFHQRLIIEHGGTF